MKEVYDATTGDRTHIIITEGDEQLALAAALSLYCDDFRMQTLAASPSDAQGYQLMQSYISGLLEGVWDGERKFRDFDEAVTAELALKRYIQHYAAAMADPLRYEQLSSYYETDNELDDHAETATKMLDLLETTILII